MQLSRRGILCCGIGAWVSVAAPPVFAHSHITHPQSKMRLHRRIERGLSDGAVLAVDRVWAVQFSCNGRGVSIEGEQVAVDVDAPAPLARLAQLEAARDTSDMFPIMLAGDGTIVGMGEIDDAGEMDKALSLAEEMLARSGDMSTHRHYLAAIQAAGSKLLDQMPRDLFFPVEPQRNDRRELPLPDGGVGSVEITYTASTSAEGPWLDRAERQVVTQVGETSRESREIWTLTAA